MMTAYRVASYIRSLGQLSPLRGEKGSSLKRMFSSQVAVRPFSTKYTLGELKDKLIAQIFTALRYGPCYQNATKRAYSQASSGADGSNPTVSPYVYPAEDLLKSLEMTANTELPSIPPGQDQEYFWRAYLLANQIILYLAARPPAEAESFHAVLQSAVVELDSPIGRGRAGILKIVQMMVDTISTLPPDSPLRAQHPEVFEAYEKLSFSHQVYTGSVLRADVLCVLAVFHLFIAQLYVLISDSIVVSCLSSIGAA
ncbi:hypothetical protein D9758_013046 [Tetrapyrgos nigripes]|uniref:Uncharacterized protein n=1 Tax=Tetrapyrgos nigripes TaxID=182062 RepID=A0A8H5CRG1_9AGAR|nr:hypothetical protein D9758_013046 [Tetrapyrgos nigripes]